MGTSTSFVRLALVAGTALAMAGCGSRPAATNTAVNANTVANDLSTPMNDASAVESAGNASTAPLPTTNATNMVDAPPPPPASGNGSVQSNIAGM